VILRHHGIHVWGDDWKKAKLMAEAYHYLVSIS
jgi:ribulose-5-phosphate 4-epimerase/fuculose-1-phosphate aldolase